MTGRNARAARARTQTHAHIAFWMPLPLAAQLTALAARVGIRRSELLRKAVSTLVKINTPRQPDP